MNNQPSSSPDLELRFGLRFKDLYNRDGLVKLDAAFLEVLGGLLLSRIAEPWTIVVFFTALFHLTRGAPLDGAFFLAITVLLIADALGVSQGQRGFRVAPVSLQDL